MRTSNCCFCVDVRTGCYVLGILTIVFGATTFLNARVASDNKYGQFSSGFGYSGVVELIAAGVMLYGLHAEKADFLLPYLIVSIIQIVGSAIIAVICVIVALVLAFAGANADKHDAGAAAQIGAVGLFLIAVCIGIYAFVKTHFAIVVNTHRDDLKNGTGASGANRYTV